MDEAATKPVEPTAGALWYCIDSAGRIVSVGGEWDASALSNDGRALVGDSVVGTSIFDHVSGHFTRKFLREFFQRARAFGSEDRVSYRCDAPHAKQLMEMRAEAGDESLLRITHRTLGQVPTPFPIVVREASPRALAHFLRCSLCNRLRRRAGGEADWREAESFAAEAVPTPVIHTVCPDCRSGVSARELWARALVRAPGGREP
jgi:hypothetical protein